MARKKSITAETPRHTTVPDRQEPVIDIEAIDDDIMSTPSQMNSVKSKKYQEHVRTIGSEIRNMNEPIRRLIIEKVVLRNFKSYGGVRTIGPFHKRFTSIVGPNGSGKSNVIDAMLFVFGFRAKQMRFDRLSDLIHNSSFYIEKNKGRPLDSMEVAIHFCEILDRDPCVDDYEIIEGSQLIISREVSHDNTSKYRINGVVSTQKQVSNALKSYGMDLYNNRFLILQGEVEQISQMKPKGTKPDEEGLLEYIEDIIGTNQYIPEIKEACARYEELQDQVQQQSNRALVSQKDIEDLQQAKDEADEYINKEKALHKMSFLLVNKELYDSKIELDEGNVNLEGLTKRLEEYEEEISHVLKDKEEISIKIKGIEEELISTTSRQKVLSDSFQKMCNKDEDLRAQLFREVKKVEEKTQLIKKLQTKKPQYEKGSKDKLEIVEELIKSLPIVQDELDKAELELEQMTDKFKPEMDKASRYLNECEQKLAPIQQLHDECSKEIKTLETSLVLMESSKKELMSKLDELKTNEKTLKLSIEKNQRSYKKMEQELESIGTFDVNAITELEGLVKLKSEEYMRFKDEYESKKIEYDELSCGNDQYNYIMSMVPGKFTGVHGRLYDLCTIDQRYEKAFIAACGSSLETIVVDTPDIASQIFDELRKQNLGRISAIALSVLNKDLKKQMDKVLSSSNIPNGIERLIDLIKLNDPKYKICFFHALRDTMVTSTLDRATEFGYGTRKRVVTLDGEIIEPDGRLCGGGVNLQKYRDKKPDKSIDYGVLSKMNEELEMKCSELDKLKNDLETMHENEDKLSKKRDNLKYELETCNQIISNDKLQLSNVETEIIKVMEEIKSLDEDNELKQVKLQLNNKRKECESIKSKIKEQELIVEEASKSLANVGNGKLKIWKDKVSELDDKLVKIRKDVEKYRKEAANLLGDAEKCSRDVNKFEKDIADHKNREKKLEQELDKLEDDAANVNKELIEVNNKHEELKKLHNELNLTLSSNNKLIQENELKTVDVKHNIDELKKHLTLLEHKIAEHQKNIQSIKNLYKNTLNLYNISKDCINTLSTYNFNHTNEPHIVDIIDGDDGEVLGIEEGDVVTVQEHDDLDDELNINEDELKKVNLKLLIKKIEELKKEMGNVPNLGVIEDYRVKVSDFINKKQELLNLQSKRDEAKAIHEQLCFNRKSEFLFNFSIIANKLKEMYQTITLGGDAELELVDSMEPFTEGILFSVRPVNKSWKQIYNLSGGEKTLSSLALVFALHHYKPNPVYFMDEIDAALDFRNVSIIAQNIKDRTKDAQFIIISLRNQMFELCNQMVGIYKTFDVTKSISIIPGSYDMRKRPMNDDGAEGE